MDLQRLGLSGNIARSFLQTEITPLLALVGLLLGFFAVIVTPREEEPQIDVTFANVFIPYPGASAREVEQLVTTGAEQILSEIEGVKHIYSISRPGMSVLTIQFVVGEKRTEAIVRLYNALYSNQDWLPNNIAIGQPLIKPKGIDDVPIVTGTLWSRDPNIGAHELLRVAHSMETELQRVPGTRDIYTIGGPERAVNVVLDPQKLAGYGIALSDLRMALASANASADAGQIVANNKVIQVQAGTFLTRAEEVADLVVSVHDGRPVYLRDVAEITFGPDTPEQYVQLGLGPASDLLTGAPELKAGQRFPAITMAVAKKPGENAVNVADAVIERFQQLRGIFVPDGVEATVTRNYGATAEDKAQTLIKKLIFATASVIILVILALGWREAVVVGAAVVITLTITLFASWAWGFTLNRVSLFALIFSIGILVDDAIVVVENIHRHLHLGGKTLVEAIPLAVDEVGGPTILATFTVIAALLPMAFVSGLMGPYMSPIPINASIGMLISLAVAFVFTPWLFLKLFRPLIKPGHTDNHAGDEDRIYKKLHHWFTQYLTPFLSKNDGHRNRQYLLATVLGLIVFSMGMVGVKWVVLKMLPFDNKSEFQVVVDMPEGTPVEQTQRVLDELANHLAVIDEVTDFQTYAGTSAPINFNGLVRQYYLRAEPNLGDIQVNLADKHIRDRQSHEIAKDLRPALVEIGKQFNANVKVVEVPPGPPVFSPLVAEIYGLDYHNQMQVAKQVRSIFSETKDIVDIDDTIEAPQKKLVVSIDRQRAARLGVSQQAVVAAIATVIGGENASYLHDSQARYPIPIRLELHPGDKADIDTLRKVRVRSMNGQLVPLGEVSRFEFTTRDQAIYHKDLLPVVFVFADMTGKLDSPLYGMSEISSTLDEIPVHGNNIIQQYWINQPINPYQSSLKWDGEWQITYETFRDMGLAYSVGLILIYLLVVAQFRSYSIPLIIMAPIPLTLIGIMPGHALLGAEFTATSMIGMIALAGIIVRNSILLVDFIKQETTAGVPLQEAVIRAGAVRARPIALTALAAMLGAFFIIDDPIFSGLAVSLIFGIFVSTLLTLAVIPILYYAFNYKKYG
ncbi:MAG: efflux RND transporter permease subunit [Gammaproteobacteria bacterium]|nr:efflux RND transporter permease subunit [Gammaproteobacteria bacterium]